MVVTLTPNLRALAVAVRAHPARRGLSPSAGVSCDTPNDLRRMRSRHHRCQQSFAPPASQTGRIPGSCNMRVRILSGSLTAASEGPRDQPSPDGLIFGLIRMRSPTFISVRINAAMQVADVNVTRRTIIPTPENRKACGSTTASRPSRERRNEPRAAQRARTEDTHRHVSTATAYRVTPRRTTQPSQFTEERQAGKLG